MYIKAGFFAAMALLVSSTTDARFNSHLNVKQNPSAGEASTGESANSTDNQFNKSVEINLDVGSVNLALFGAGTFVGLMATYGQDLENDCLSDSVRLTVAGVHTYEYMTDYIATNKTDNIILAQAIIYLIDGFETLSVIDCSNFDADLEQWAENKDWSSMFAMETEPTVSSSESRP